MPVSRPSKPPEAPSTTPGEISVSGKNIEASSTSIPVARLQPLIPATTVFSVLLVVRLLSAKYATIPDCDEVFNYWEPTHYLQHGNGLQTWEYSPEFAIRSWAYVGLHAAAGKLFSLIPQMSKIQEFYFLRILFAVICAYSETSLCSSISRNINRRVGVFYFFTTLCSAGMFHASASFLPSTFSMFTTTLGMSAFIDRSRGYRTVEGIFWFALGGLLGWPFSLAMCVPFIVEELFERGIGWGVMVPRVVRIFKGGVLAAALLGAIVAVDSVAYKKLEIVPLNIVLYNVFSGPGRGPNIYGTEPWWFYFANLSLNFNLQLVFALTSLPLLLISYFRPNSRTGYAPRMLTLAMPFYLWLTIFTLQPHKEERFMFVAYPSICVNAAMTYHILLTAWGRISSKVLPAGKFQELLNWTVLILPLVATAAVSLSRVLAIVTAYSAPMHVLQELPSNATGKVCYGKEWYRFPGSYFLPEGMRVGFVEAAFDGLLPGQFFESSGWTRPGTWMIPEGMNDLNLGDKGKYTDIQNCDYLVESYFHRPLAAAFEADLEVGEQWKRFYCERFLNAPGTPMLGRTLWLPGQEKGRKWGEYCLLERI
ncbi:mannosyltransferase [Rhizina undulata]